MASATDKLTYGYLDQAVFLFRNTSSIREGDMSTKATANGANEAERRAAKRRK